MSDCYIATIHNYRLLQCYEFISIYCYITTNALRATATVLRMYYEGLCYGSGRGNAHILRSTATKLQMHYDLRVTAKMLRIYYDTATVLRIYYDLLLQCYVFTMIYCYSSMHLLWSTSIVLRIYYDLPLRCYECTTSECSTRAWYSADTFKFTATFTFCTKCYYG